jgi:hypothetical protein
MVVVDIGGERGLLLLLILEVTHLQYQQQTPLTSNINNKPTLTSNINNNPL